MTESKRLYILGYI